MKAADADGVIGCVPDLVQVFWSRCSWPTAMRLPERSQRSAKDIAGDLASVSTAHTVWSGGTLVENGDIDSERGGISSAIEPAHVPILSAVHLHQAIPMTGTGDEILRPCSRSSVGAQLFGRRVDELADVFRR